MQWFEQNFGSARRQHHDHLPALELGLLLDLGEFPHVGLEPVQKLGAEFLVGHLTPAEAQRHLDLVAFLEEAQHRTHLHVVVVVVDHGPEFDFLDLDHLLALAGLGRLLLLLILELAVIEQLADRRRRIGGDLDKIEPGLLGYDDRFRDRDGAFVGSVLVDQMNFASANLLVDARAVLLDGGRGA